MAKATAICTCRICSTKFTKTTTKYNRKEADNWEEWAVHNYDLCPKCWGEEQRKAEQLKPLTLVVDCDPYQQFIILHFAGNTMPVKDQIGDIGYKWGDVPMLGTFGAISINRPPLAWHKIISDMDLLEDALHEVVPLNPVLQNNISAIDRAMFAKIKADKDAKTAADAARQSEINSRKASIPRPTIPTKIVGKRWNNKIYGKKGSYSIYPDNVKISLTDEEAAEIERYLAAKIIYDKSIKEIDDEYK